MAAFKQPLLLGCGVFGGVVGDLLVQVSDLALERGEVLVPRRLDFFQVLTCLRETRLEQFALNHNHREDGVYYYSDVPIETAN